MDISNTNGKGGGHGAWVCAGGVLALWYAATSRNWISSLILPPPGDVARALSSLTVDGVLAPHLISTAARVSLSLTIAIAVGVPVGLWFGYSRRLYRYIEPAVHALRSIPATALFPLLLIVVGVGDNAIVALAVYPSLLVIIVNTVSGVTFANQKRIDAARVLEIGPIDMIREVLFYEALPSIFHGVRTAVSYTFVLVVAVEMFIGVSENGLGRAIYDFQTTYRIPETYATVIVAGFCGIVLNAIVTSIESRMLHWLPNQDSGGKTRIITRNVTKSRTGYLWKKGNL